MNRVLVMFASFCLLHLVAVDSALAWGQNGHRIVAQVADDNLSGQSRAQIRLILGDENLANASNWPDDMRSSPEPYWQSVAWKLHFVTVPVGKRYSEVETPTGGDAFTALAQFRRDLLSPDTTREQKQRALRFALHIIGDLHQPLHAGNGTDRGGNQLEVEFFNEQTNLHRVWDTGMIKQQNLSYTEYALFLQERLTPENIITWSTTDVETWISESTDLRDRIYPDDREIGYEYLFQHRDALEMRLAMGGIREATWLNDVFHERGTTIAN